MAGRRRRGLRIVGGNTSSPAARVEALEPSSRSARRDARVRREKHVGPASPPWHLGGDNTSKRRVGTTPQTMNPHPPRPARRSVEEPGASAFYRMRPPQDTLDAAAQPDQVDHGEGDKAMRDQSGPRRSLISRGCSRKPSVASQDALNGTRGAHMTRNGGQSTFARHLVHPAKSEPSSIQLGESASGRTYDISFDDLELGARFIPFTMLPPSSTTPTPIVVPAGTPEDGDFDATSFLSLPPRV